MLRRVAPSGRVLKDVYLEVFRDSLTLGRQMGSYPLLVALPYPTDLERFTDVYVTDHGFRSITAVEHPFPINRESMKAIQVLPGVGKKRAARLVRARPFRTFEDFQRALDDPDVAEPLLGHLDFS
jgi:radical SAM superfamily enzyme with C-terminal helix-hairpin-helix motif